MTTKGMQSEYKNAPMSPRKIGLIAKLIRHMKVEKALRFLPFMNKKAADLIFKLLKSSVSNAEQHGRDRKNLVIESVYVGPGIKMKRYMPRARGRSGKIIKRFTNIQIILSELEQKENEQ